MLGMLFERQLHALERLGVAVTRRVDAIDVADLAQQGLIDTLQSLIQPLQPRLHLAERSSRAGAVGRGVGGSTRSS